MNRTRRHLPLLQSEDTELDLLAAIVEGSGALSKWRRSGVRSCDYERDAAAFSHDLASSAMTNEQVLEWATEIAAMEQEMTSKRWVFTACRSGCAHCCFVPVAACPVEVVIVHHAASAQLGYEERVMAAAARVRKNRLGHIACPLLHEGKCSVYSQRPAACRGENGLDAAECAVIGGRHHYIAELQQLPHHVMFAGQVAFKARGLDIYPVDLRLALAEIASLPIEEPLRRWLSGERLFPTSRLKKRG